MTEYSDNSRKKKNQWPAPFFCLWSGQAMAMILSETVQFALIWWLTDTFRSAAIVGWATMTALLPRAILNPFIGAMVDRWDRRSILIVSHMVIILSMAYLGILFQAQSVTIGSIYSVIFICACGKSFQSPAIFASTALMVPLNYINRIAGLNQTLQGVMRVVAPSIGAILIATVPMYAIVIVDIAGASLGILILIFVVIPKPLHTIASGPLTTGWQLLIKDVIAGIQFVWNWRGAREMLFISTLVNFLTCPAFMMISLLVSQHFEGSESEFGWISSAIGIGMICGGVLLSIWGGFHKPMLTSLMGVIGMAFAMLVTGLAPVSAFWLATVCMFMAGFMIPICTAPIQALVQKTVNPDMQGRILSLLDCVSTAISPISLAVAGPFFEQFGPPTWYFGSGLLAFTIGIGGLLIQRVTSFGVLPVENT